MSEQKEKKGFILNWGFKMIFLKKTTNKRLFIEFNYFTQAKIHLPTALLTLVTPIQNYGRQKSLN